MQKKSDSLFGSVEETTDWILEKLEVYALICRKDVLLYIPFYFYRSKLCSTRIDEIAAAIRGDFDIDADLTEFLKSKYGKKKRFWWKVTVADILEFIVNELDKNFLKEFIVNEIINLVDTEETPVETITIDAHFQNDLHIHELDIYNLTIEISVQLSIWNSLPEEKLMEFSDTIFTNGREILDFIEKNKK